MLDGSSIQFDRRGDWRLPFAGLSAPTRLLRCDASGSAILYESTGIAARFPDPLAGLRWLESQCEARHRGVWAGFLSYDLAPWLEPAVGPARDDASLPLFAFAFCPAASDQETPATPASPLSASQRAASPLSHLPPAQSVDLQADFTRGEYEAAVARAIAFIEAGDVFQVNLSQRFTAPIADDLAAIDCRLRAAAPARFGATMHLGDVALLCNSPELFLRIAGGKNRSIATRPIKGTRPRGPGMKNALRDSPKDAAELNMIIDLERNDLGRVCKIGSVRVIEPRAIETHPTLHHGVATITGILRDDVDLVELLAATFPGGSVTGAPKIRAMQIVAELEKTPRGPYCGAIGFLASDGSMQFAVAIRTMVAASGRLNIHVGGGIVADSRSDEEYEETLVKAAAMFAAAGVRIP